MQMLSTAHQTLVLNFRMDIVVNYFTVYPMKKAHIYIYIYIYTHITIHTHIYVYIISCGIIMYVYISLSIAMKIIVFGWYISFLIWWMKWNYLNNLILRLRPATTRHKKSSLLWTWFIKLMLIDTESLDTGISTYIWCILVTSRSS